MAGKSLLRRENRTDDLRHKFESMTSLAALAKPSRLRSLPREIHIHILKELNPACQLSLGLTCKDLWAVVQKENTGDSKVLMTDNDKREFLGLLSNNVPRYIVCYECKVMHRRDVDEFRMIQSGDEPYKLCNNTRAAFPAPCLEYALTYETLELVLRFDELSSDHGVPMSLLSHQCNFHDTHTKQLPCKVEVLPRLCQGRLLLRIDSYVEIDRDGTFGDQVDRIPSLPCMHMETQAFTLHCALTLRFGTVNLKSGQKWHAMDRWCVETLAFDKIVLTECSGHCATDASTMLMLSEDGMLEGLLVRVWKDFGSRGGYGKQPWTGHVATYPQVTAIYASGDKHLGHIFDGDESPAESYDTKTSLDPFQRLQAGLV